MVMSTRLIRGSRNASVYPQTSSANATTATVTDTIRERCGLCTPATRSEPQHLTQQGPDEQHPDHAEDGVADARRPVLRPASVSQIHQHGQADEGRHEDHR